jgi:hypothetical protein
MTVTATFNGEEIQVSFTAETERTDYGVPGSPVWDEIIPETIEATHLTILGLDVKLSDLPPDLQDAIIALSDEVDFT